ILGVKTDEPMHQELEDFAKSYLPEGMKKAGCTLRMQAINDRWPTLRSSGGRSTPPSLLSGSAPASARRPDGGLHDAGSAATGRPTTREPPVPGAPAVAHASDSPLPRRGAYRAPGEDGASRTPQRRSPAQR